ncbi:hypothetical protein BDZ94DRAFT_1308690 [Collybia nuda]|uniref:Uncharacterized protein n=1 Tax=Collybia nuda TaxID=64659 RepID=A0A9P5Y5C4_9AGAR|nr:hypothetical protein BDZ94DRAFT_1308690 [Collybia nuda]
MNESSTKRLTKIIFDLGGPPVADSDIEWALDLPAGMKLLDWLAAQLGDSNGEKDDTISVDEGNEYNKNLRAIALEAEEVKILKHIGPPVATDMGDAETIPVGYLLPSRLKKQAEYMNNETNLWEEEARLLKIRLQQTRLASQKMTQSVKLLQAALERETLDINQNQDRLADLSLLGDTTISSTVKGAQSLLDAIGCNPCSGSTMEKCSLVVTEVVSELGVAVKSLSSLASLRSSIIDLHALQTEQLDDTSLKIPSLDVIKADAAQLQDVLTAQLYESVLEVTYFQELEDICNTLESSDITSTTLQQILETNIGTDIGLGRDLDVNDILETAWSLDQAAILDARGKILDQTITAYKDDLIEPLKMLQQSLSTIEKQARDSEVLIGALGIELEEIVDDVRSSKENNEITPPKPTEDSLDEELEERLSALLKDLKDLRPRDAPPLVLLQQNDIIQELAFLIERTEILQEREKTLIVGLPLALSATRSIHAPFLSRVYEYSPVNTSPPFSLSPDAVCLQDKAKFKGDDLVTNVGRLQKDLDSLMGSSRTKRKLGTFIDKWYKPT